MRNRLLTKYVFIYTWRENRTENSVERKSCFEGIAFYYLKASGSLNNADYNQYSYLLPPTMRKAEGRECAFVRYIDIPFEYVLRESLSQPLR